MKLTRSQIKKQLDEFQKAAKIAGIKVTPQRLTIYKIVASSDSHPTAEEVYQALKAGMPTISLDTVYRTLWILTDLGFLHTVYQPRGSVRFDAITNKHHHFFCIRCFKIRDFENSVLSSLPIPREAEECGRTISLRVEVQGICEECLKEDLTKIKDKE